MQITSILASLLLAAPAIVIAVPVASSTVVTPADIRVNEVFTRQSTCNPVWSTDNTERQKQEEAFERMKSLTKEYHDAERGCPSTAIQDFDKLKKKQKDKAKALQTKCINAYATCAKKRTDANKACIAAGGTVDAGHQTAIKVCKDKAANGEPRRPNGTSFTVL